MYEATLAEQLGGDDVYHDGRRPDSS